MTDLITGVTVDTTRSVDPQSPITNVGASASLVVGSRPTVETTNFDTETFRREKWNLCGTAMSDDDACPRPRLCTEHFDLTADDSQDEDMHGCELACPCRTATPHRVRLATLPVDGLSVDGERAMGGHHSRVQGELDPNEEGDANHGRQDRSLCGVGRLH